MEVSSETSDIKKCSWQTPLCNRHLRLCDNMLIIPIYSALSHSYMLSCMLSQYISYDDKWYAMIVLRIMYLSLTIQRKCDLKTLSSEK